MLRSMKTDDPDVWTFLSERERERERFGGTAWVDLVGPLGVLMLAWRGCLFLREGAIFQSGTWFISAPRQGPATGGTGAEVVKEEKRQKEQLV